MTPDDFEPQVLTDSEDNARQIRPCKKRTVKGNQRRRTLSLPFPKDIEESVRTLDEIVVVAEQEVRPLDSTR